MSNEGDDPFADSGDDDTNEMNHPKDAKSNILANTPKKLHRRKKGLFDETDDEDEEPKKSLAKSKNVKRKKAVFLDDSSSDEDDEPKKPMSSSKPGHLEALVQPQKGQKTTGLPSTNNGNEANDSFGPADMDTEFFDTGGDDEDAINELYEAQQMILLAEEEEETRMKEKIKKAGSNRSSKRKASRKQVTSKRFKTDPNNDEATKCLMADTLFGCFDVVSLMFSFLDVRQLLRFVCVSKEFKSLLTYDHVVRATMLSGGFPQTSLKRMDPPIRNRNIWIPSPLRLLRTLCGKKCERCNDSPNRFVCEAFGVFLCKRCTNNSLKLFRRSQQWNGYLDAPRVCRGPQKGRTGHSRMYLMLTPMKDVAGNHVGPLVTAQDLETMVRDEQDQSATPKEKVAAWIQKCDARQPHADAAVNTILKALEDNREESVNRRATRRERRAEAKDRNAKARRQKSDELMSNLMDLLHDEDPDIIAQLNNTKSWNDHLNSYVFRHGTIAHKLLTPVFKTPSKYSAKKKLQQVANELVLKIGEKKLMDVYIQRIADHCDHPGTDDIILKRRYRTFSFSYDFSNPNIRDILKEPLSKPRDLSDERVQQLADQVKKIAHRRAPGEKLLQKLDERLNGSPFESDLWDRNWDSRNWSWTFGETYVYEVLYKPISKPEDITKDRLEELEQQLRASMEKKKLVQNRMKLLLAPIAKQYPAWYRKLEQWEWNSKNKICFFWDLRAKQLLGDGKELENVEQMDDAEIGELSNRLLIEIEKRLSS